MNTPILNTTADAYEAMKEILALRDRMMTNSAYLPPYYPKGTIRFSEASISTKLCALMEADLEKANLTKEEPAEIFIVGADESYFEVGNEAWKHFLLRWTDAELVNFRYLLTDLDTAGKEKLATFKRKAKNPRLINFLAINPKTAPLPDSVQNLMKCWKTEHFVIGLKGPKILWMEAHHEPKTHTAYDCAYFKPEVCNKTPDWAICKNSVEAIDPYLTSISN